MSIVESRLQLDEMIRNFSLNITSDEISARFREERWNSWLHSAFMLIMFAVHATLFGVGMIGNVWVISVLISIMRNLTLPSGSKHVFVYTFCLATVDLCVTALLPVLISDAVLVRWVFGKTLCKLYLITESTNKILSTFILTALSFDRYLAVCRPNVRCKLRTTKGTLAGVGCLSVIVFALLMPVHLYADVIVVEEFVEIGNHTLSLDVAKCTLDLHGDLIVWFTLYICTVGFCLPSALIIFFYARVLIRIYRHTKNVSCNRTQIPVKRVTGATLMIVVFFFVCWTPYWITTLFMALAPDAAISTHVAKVFYVVHSMVYVNSAFNWVFYALLNNHLRDSHDMALEKKRSRTASWFYFESNNNNNVNTNTNYNNINNNYTVANSSGSDVDVELLTTSRDSGCNQSEEHFAFNAKAIIEWNSKTLDML